MSDRPPGATPSQTLGPFFEPALLRNPLNVLAGPGVAGEHIRIEGRVLDGEAVPVPDALVELWQANAEGRYRHPADDRNPTFEPGFTGFGRSGTDEDGRFWFETVRPGRVPFAEGEWQAPHLCLTVGARGLLNHLATRLYFADDERTAADPILRHVPAARRSTLLAQPAGGEPPRYRFDLVLRGAPETETVFFTWRR